MVSHVDYKLWTNSRGVFKDTSCGDFGTRYYIDYDNKKAYWGSMVEDPYSDFNGKEVYFQSLADTFNVPTNEMF